MRTTEKRTAMGMTTALTLTLSAARGAGAGPPCAPDLTWAVRRFSRAAGAPLSAGSAAGGLGPGVAVDDPARVAGNCTDGVSCGRRRQSRRLRVDEQQRPPNHDVALCSVVVHC